MNISLLFGHLSALLKSVALLIFFTSGLDALAQDKLLLMDGTRLEVRILNKDASKVVFEREKKNGTLKTDSLYTPELFSVTAKGEQEEMRYVQDAMLGDEFTEEDMRYYIYGLDDARQGYNALPTMIGGFAVGAAGTIAMEGGIIPTMGLPLAYGFGMQIPIIRIREETITDTRWKQSPTYLDGYNKKARSKKFIGGFMRTLVGSLVGSGIVLLIEK